MNGHQTLPFFHPQENRCEGPAPGWWLATVARAKALTKVVTKVGHTKYYY